MEERDIPDNELYYRVKRVLKATRRQYWLVLYVGAFLAGLGLILLITALSSVNSFNGYQSVLAFSAIIVVTFIIGGAFIGISLRLLIPYLRDLRTLKNGTESTARITGIDWRYHRRHRLNSDGTYQYPYYSMKLCFFDNGGKKIFNTLYYYTEQQYVYLQKIRTVKIKHLNGRAVIIEDIPEKQ